MFGPRDGVQCGWFIQEDLCLVRETECSAVGSYQRTDVFFREKDCSAVGS